MIHRRTVMIGAFFVLLAVALFPRALTGSTFFHYDTWMQNLTFRAWWFDQLRAGNFATWCPGMFAGYPLFAETQTGPLYPPTFLLFLLLPATTAFPLGVLFHFALAGGGAYCLARRLGAAPAAALFAGAAYELSGALVTHVVHFNLLTGAAWMPWAVAAALAVWDGRPRAMPALAAVLALMLLGAHPYATLMALLLVAVIGAARSVARPGFLARGAVPVAAAALLAVLLAAVQVLPTRELLERTPRARAVDWSFLTFGSFPPWHVPTIVSPDLYGTPVDGSFHAGPDWSHYAETCAYAGVVTVALAVVALALRGDAGTQALGLATLLSFLLMLGKYTPVYRFLTWIPLFQSTRLPGRFALPFTLGLVVLAALGIQALRDADVRSRRRALLAGSAVVGALLVAAWFLGADARSPDEWIASTGRAWAERMALIREAALAAARFSGIAALAGIAALLPFAARRVPRWAPAGCIVVVAAELLFWGRSFNPMLPADVVRQAPPAVAALPDAESRPRVFRQGVDEMWARVPGMPRTDLFTPAWEGQEPSYASGAWALPPNSQLLYGVDSGEGFTSLLPSQWLEWMGLANAPGATPRPDLTEAQADLLSIDAVISTGSGISGEGWDPVALPGDVYVSRNADPLPRVRVASRWETMDRDALLRRIRDPGHDPRAGALLEAAPPGAAPTGVAARADGGGAAAPVPAREIGPGHWEIDAPAGGGLIVLAESWDPDWRAVTADGRRLPVFRADGLFAAFVAPEGGGRVVLRHRPPAVVRGAIASGIGVLILAALLIRGRRGAETAASGGPWPVPLRIAVPALGLGLAAVAWSVDLGDARRDQAAGGLTAEAGRAWEQEAMAARAAGALGPAADLLRAARRARPWDVGLLYRLGRAEEAAGRPAEARAAWEEALRIDPGFAPARDALQAAGRN